MTQILKQATAVDVLIGPFVDLTDGYTAETGETPVVKLSKNGQALAAKSDVTVPVHDADGYYNCELDTTDTDTVGTLILTVAASANALPVRHEFQVMEEAIYDALYGSGADGFDANARVDVGKWLGTAVTTSSTSAKPEVDTYSVSDDATAANNLELACDGTGYGFTNCTMPTVTTLTGHTAQTGDTYAALPSNFSVMGIEADGDLTKVNTLDGHTAQTGDTYAELPTNFSDLAITATTGQVTVGTNNDKTGYSLASDGLDLVTAWTVNITGSLSGSVGSVTGNVGGNVTGSVGSISGVTFPTNFSDLAITVTTGRVDVASIEGSDATNQIRDAVVDDATRIDASALNTLSGHDPGGTIASSTQATALNTSLTNIKGPGFDVITDSLAVLRDRGDAAWITATTVDLNADQSGATIGTVNALASAAIEDVWETDALTESYAADGAAPTPAQALFLIQQALTEFAITSTTISVKKLDGTTEAATFTLDDDTSPTSRTRAT